jgi:glycosyltransferase involved in cell wall biosynthesis
MIPSISLSPKLSIGLPVYNGERFLGQALDCLLAQTFRDFEIIISDNASSDRTPQICRTYAQRDHRIRYVRNQRNLGLIANFNLVFELSSTPLFKWAAHDDLHRDTYLENCVGVLDNHPDVVLANTNTAFIDENNELFPLDPQTGNYLDPKTGVPQMVDSLEIGERAAAVGRFWQVLSHARWSTHLFGVFRRQDLKQTRLLGDFYGSDRTLLAELALLGRFRTNPEPLFLKRIHPNVSWVLTQEELKDYLFASSEKRISRIDQLRAYLSAPRGKSIRVIDKSICTMMVAAHCVRVAARSLTTERARWMAQKSVWRRQTECLNGSASQSLSSFTKSVSGPVS